MRNPIIVVLVFLLLIILPATFSWDTSLYEQAKTQCVDRFDKEKCLSHFHEVLQANDPLLKESNARKEQRYTELQEEKNDQFARLFQEEFDYGTRRIDAMKLKVLRSMEKHAKQSFLISKEAAVMLADQYQELLKKATCVDLDEEECQEIRASLQEIKYRYISHVGDGVGYSITAMMAYAQKSPFLTESDAALLNSELNQALAQTRLFRARIKNQPLSDGEINDLSSLISALRALHRKMSLLHTYGHLYALSRQLAAMHRIWERKLIHLIATQEASEFLPRIILFSASLDNALADLHEAAKLLPLEQKEKQVISHLSRAYTALVEGAKEQKEMMHQLSQKGLTFTPYDVIEETIDNRMHGLGTETKIQDEPIITAKLYPEKGQTVVIISQEPPVRYSFSTVDEEKLLDLIAEKTKQDKNVVKQQLRFEVGGR